MKYALAVMALSLAACSAPTAPHKAPNSEVRHTLNVGDPCTTSDGFSGYTVNLGNKLVCQV